MHAQYSPFDVDTAPYDLLDSGDVYCPLCGEGFSPLCDTCPDCDTPLQHPANDGSLLGVVLDGRYRVLRPLSSGAMGHIYEGIQLGVKRPIAIKLIRGELLRDDAITQRFWREAKLSMLIAHPNIVEVFDYGETENASFYIVMELLRGEPLDSMLARVGRFDVETTIDIGLQICDALVVAHAHGVVHRDLKPANIVVLPELGNWVKVLDFGLAKSVADPTSEITAAGVVLGTPLYMSPELIREGMVDPRGDLYALGCMLHELLTGTPPFSGETSALVIVRQLDDPPPPLPSDVPLGLAHLIAALLAKFPDDRPDSALVVRDTLAWLAACRS